MAGLPDPERIFAAKKAGVLEWLVGSQGIPRDWAKAWLESREGGAADIHDLRRDPDFWKNGYDFVMREYNAGHQPPSAPDITSDERDPRL